MNIIEESKEEIKINIVKHGEYVNDVLVKVYYNIDINDPKSVVGQSINRISDRKLRALQKELNKYFEGK